MSSSSTITTTTTVPLTTTFTPPASCATSWTYEASSYNDIPSGILEQVARSVMPNTECFPSGFWGYGRAFRYQVFSPGVCPEGYTTNGLSLGAGTGTDIITTATCCQSGYGYTSANDIQGCTSIFTGETSVPARTGSVSGTGTDADTTSSTSISGTFTMWGQPITVEFRSVDATLFTPTSSSTTSTSTSSTTGPATNTNTSSPSTSSGLSTGAKAGIAIGVVVGVLLIASAVGFFIWRHRKARKSKSNMNAVPGPYTYTDVPSAGYQNESYEVGNYGGDRKPLTSELPATESRHLPPAELPAEASPRSHSPQLPPAELSA